MAVFSYATLPGTSPNYQYGANSIANASFINVTYALINFSYNLTNNDTFYIIKCTGTSCVNTSPIARNTSTSGTGQNAGFFYYNFTGLNDANYTFNPWANDTSGTVIWTNGNKTYTYVDTVAPAISFIANTIANNSFINTNYVFINTSENDAGNDHNDYSAYLDFNRSLVGYWRFEEGGGSVANDSSSYGNNGTISGIGCTSLNCNLTGGIYGSGTGWTSAGKRGNGLIFDAKTQTYVNLGLPPSLNLTDSGTFEAWIQAFNASGCWAGTGQSIVGWSPSSGQHNLWVRICNKDLIAVFFNKSTGVINNAISNNFTWYHIAATTMPNSNLKVYVNGVMVASVPSSTNKTIQPGSMYIGRLRTSASYTHEGLIDEVKIWNRALSEQEINASYNAGVYRLQNNFTSLPDGNYSYYAAVVDAAGNLAITNNQSVMVDTVAPAISFIANTPANNSFINTNYVFINTSENDAGSDHNDYSAYVDFNRSLVGYWRFEEGGNVNANDSSTYNNTGTLTNFGCTTLNCNLTGGLGGTGSGWTSAGKRGKGLIYNGKSNYLSYTSIITPLGAKTIEFWIKANNGTNQVIYDNSGNDDTSKNGTIIYYHTDAKLHFSLLNGTGRDFSVPAVTALNSTYALVDCVWDGTNASGAAKIYINGVLDASRTPYAAETVSPSYNLSIGRATNGVNYLNATLDEMKVYNRALSEQEINASYNAGIYRLSANFTNLADGNYSYRAYVVDAAGNINQTENRTFTIDTILPTITNYNSNSNGTVNNKRFVYVNYTTNNSEDYSTTYDFNRSLLGWWRFEEPSGASASDSSSYSNTGTLTNFECTTLNCNLTGGTSKKGSGRTSAGARGKAISTGGGESNYITMGTGVPNPNTEFTLESWAYEQERGAWKPLMGKLQNSGQGYGIFLNDGYANGCYNDLSGGWDCVTATTRISLRRWTHIASTLSFNISNTSTHDLILYVNGIKVQTMYYTKNMTTFTGIFASSWGTGTTGFNGSVDEIKLWSKALNQTEINASYNAGIYRIEQNYTNLPDGEYNYSISAVDSAGNLATTGTVTVRVDTTLPTVTINNPPSNNSLLRYPNNNIQFNVSCWDDNLYGCGIAIYNISGGLNYSNESTNIAGNLSKNISLMLKSGYYTIVANATDDLTFSPPIPDLKETIEGTTVLMEDKEAGISWTVTPAVSSKSEGPKEDKEIGLQAKVTELKNKKHTDYLYDFRGVKNPEDYTITLRLQSDQEIAYRSPISGVSAHFVIGDRYYWNAQDVVDAGFRVSVEKQDDHLYTISIKEGETKWASSNSIDPVSGGLNKVSTNFDFIVDGISPTYSGNGTNVTTPNVGQSVGLSINVSDDFNISRVILEHSFSYGMGSLINVTVPLQSISNNITFNVTMPAAYGSLMSYKFYIYDWQNNSNLTPMYYLIGCVETWECSGWVLNNTDGIEYRNCVDTSGCGSVLVKPAVNQNPIIVKIFQIFVILLVLAFSFLVVGIVFEQVSLGVMSGILFLASAAMVLMFNPLSLPVWGVGTVVVVFLMIGVFVIYQAIQGGD